MYRDKGGGLLSPEGVDVPTEDDASCTGMMGIMVCDKD